MSTTPLSPSPRRTAPTHLLLAAWRGYLAFPLIWKMLIALAIGALTGLIVGEPVTVVEPLGQVFLQLLQMLVVPLILTTLIAGVASINPARLGSIGLKVLVFYLVTSALAITIGILLALAITPGAGLSMPGTTDEEPESPPALSEVFLDIIPENPFAAMVEGNVLAVIFVAIAAGIALAFMQNSANDHTRELGDFLRRGVDGAVELVFRVVRGVLEYAPVGVFALIAVVLAETGAEALRPLLELTVATYGGIALQILVYVGLLTIFRAAIGPFFLAAKDPMLTGFVTRSSGGTLPVTIRAAERLGIRKGVYGFTLPFGATVNMDGTAIYVGAATVFVANVAGVQLSLIELATVVIVGVLASIGTAGVPGAGLIMLSLTVTQAGLPFAPVALVAGIDAILDMARTMCNVTGDLVATRIIAGTEPGMLADPGSAPAESTDAAAGTDGSGSDGTGTAADRSD
ncbi:dicarboxylate/amino acid:cation symporter [Lipingzhangella sp. LS1_29]|uniref:Dicarboxylate/amino acid:cation symporter n=1 Tax=Lipingzhangella rawalii TaxID=2055835 RepID=A0ABU2H1M4_9ACTN|nr:dicarboxylate/amino acid:cation symporter [Lipingzhangella rawalii]MDS1269193.1 dicarboxylate/amino acid:cation symporter [Lipingzhangella rawalii]